MDMNVFVTLVDKNHLLIIYVIRLSETFIVESTLTKVFNCRLYKTRLPTR